MLYRCVDVFVDKSVEGSLLLEEGLEYGGPHTNCMVSPVAGTLHSGAAGQKASHSKYSI